MSKQIKQLDRHVESVLVSLDILDSFIKTPEMRIKDITEKTGLTRNRVTRIIGTLLYKGYLMDATGDGVFTPGPKLRILGDVFEENQNFIVLISTVLRQLALKTGESATFYVREGLERVVLAREGGTNAIRFLVSPGQRMELYAGSAGKVLLAFASKAEKEILLKEMTLNPITNDTITSAKELSAEMDMIANKGFSVSMGERNPDVFSISVPVFENDTKLVGALSIAGPISRLREDNQERFLSELLASAKDISN